MKTYKRILTIAGSDSGGGAGIQADLKTYAACGCYGASVITSITSQNTCGVSNIYTLPAEVIESQCEAVLSDIGADALKIGMLPSVESIDVVIRILRKYKPTHIVLDPVMISTSGATLISKEAIAYLQQELFPLVTLLTPNLDEAAYLTGMVLHDETDFAPAAEAILRTGPAAVLMKAGHLTGKVLSDQLYLRDSKQVYTYTFPRLDTPNTHGTGCSLSSAIAAFLAAGNDYPQAVQLAENYLHRAILIGAHYKIGHGHGPVHHFWNLWR